jgi:dephospho-CoA kinase
MRDQIILGLTGPIASGKNTVAKIFSRRGAYVIDADKIGHQVIAPQSKAWHEIVKVFGSKVLNRGGAINRRKLAGKVFASPAALRKLNRITHPELRKIIIGEIKSARLSNKRFIIVNAAILNEMKLVPLVDKVVVVLAGKAARIRRLIKAGSSRSDALARIRVQGPDSRYRKIADHVIVNDKDTEDLKQKVKRIISAL